VRFYDFDVGLRSSSFRELLEVNLRYRAFVEAVGTELGTRQLDAPWRKFYVTFTEPGQDSIFMGGAAEVRISVAGVYLGLPDPALLTTQGEAIRSLLAHSVGAIAIASRGIVGGA
jgi:hypothetical protein